MRDNISPTPPYTKTGTSSMASPPSSLPAEIPPSRHTTPLDASGADRPNNVKQPSKPNRTNMPSSSARHYHMHTSRHNMNIILQYDRARNAARRSPTPTTDRGVPDSLKRKSSSASMAPGSQPLTISRFTNLLATCTDEHFTYIIHHLPESWLATNDKGSIVTK